MAHDTNPQEANTWTLVTGICLIPVSYIAYCAATRLNIRCHVPSWDGWNAAYEIVPYLFVALLVGFMVSFAMRVVSADTHITDSLLGSIMTFVAGIFAPALIFRAYGLEEPSGYLTPVLPTQAQFEDLTIQGPQGQETWVANPSELENIYVAPEPDIPAAEGQIIVVAPDPAFGPERFPLVVLEPHKRMVESSIDYLFYSIANAIPGEKAYDYEVCPSAAHFVIMQNVFGLIMTIIIALLGNRLGEIRHRTT